MPVEGLAEAANHTAKVGEVQGSLADALEWSGISVESFNEKLAAAGSEQERQQLITKTLNDLYGESAKKYKEVNKDVLAAEKAQMKLTDALASLGAVGEPILTAIKDKMADMVSKAAPKLQSLINKIKDMIKWVKSNKSTVDTWAAVVIGATVAISGFILAMKISAIMSSATKAIKATTAAVKALNLAMKSNVIGLIISLIAGLVAAFVYLWKNNEGFRNFWLKMWDKIKSATGTAVSWIKSKFNSLKDAVSKVKNNFESIRRTISDKINSAKDAVKSVVDKIKGFFPLKIGKIFSNFKIPKISVSGGKAPFGIAGKGRLPSFDVNWNAEGAIFDEPTIFATSKGFQGVGEAGKEAVAPIDTLQQYISDSVGSKNNELIQAFETQVSRLISFMQEYFPTNYGIMLDTGVLAGQLTPDINRRLADIYKSNSRGNTL